MIPFDSLISLPIDLANPIVRDHQFNRGLVGWWLTLPGLNGGRQWFDLVRANHGTLTGMTSTGGWRYASRPGGWGEMAFDGTDDYVAPAAQLGITTQPRTISVWVKPQTSTGLRCVYQFGAYTNLCLCGLLMNVNTMDVYNSNYASDFYTANNVLAVNRWNHITHVYNGGTLSTTTVHIYVDGVEKSLTKAGVIVGAATTTNSGFRIGSDPLTAGRQWNGSMDDLRISNQDLTSAEVRDQYNESCLGYPNMIRRVTPWSAFLRGPTSGIKAIAGVPYASISKISGVPIASALKVAGLA